VSIVLEETQLPMLRDKHVQMEPGSPVSYGSLGDLLSHEGYAMSPTHQLLLLHPRYVVRILAADPAALLEVPLKFTAYRGSSSNRLTVPRHFT
jgi:hypothetical protein